MNRRFQALLAAAMLLCMSLAIPLNSAKGFGDFDSDSDWGGSDWGDSDSGSDWGGSDWGSDWSDSDTGSSRNYRYSRTGDDSNAGLGVFIICLILIPGIIIVVNNNKKQSKKCSAAERRQEEAWARKKKEREKKETRERRELNAYEEFKSKHPEFSEAALFEYVKKLFMEMQEGWEAGDISNVKYGFHPDTWQRFDTQLAMKNRRGETTHVRKIKFQSIKVIGYRLLSGNNQDKLTLRLRVEYNVWVTDRNGKNIQGSPSTRHLMTYVWDVQRPHGTAEAKIPADLNHCPNCGAELDAGAFAECPFCHTQIRQGSANWLIRDIRAEAQKTV